MAIDTIDDLRTHVALARQVEMSTIPPYLYSAYSIKDQDSDAAKLIISVVVEEMLHLALTTNLLLALGGEPDWGPTLMQRYPSLMAHHQPDLMLHLTRCRPEVVRDLFMTIERPESPGAPPEDDEYETLGQFYLALELAIDALAQREDIFGDHQPERQLSDPSLYGAVKYVADDSGGLMMISDAVSAKAALEVIIHQGEGVSAERWADESHQELTHYWKFGQIADGTSPIGETWPVVDDPRSTDFPEALRPVSDLFNAVLRLVFSTMEGMFSSHADQGALAGRLYSLMSEVLSPVARLLMTQPMSESTNAGPTFEWYEFSAAPESEVLQLADSVAANYPDLEQVAQTLSVVLP